MNYAPIDADGHVMETDDELRRYLPAPFEGRRALTALFPSLDGWPRSTRKAPDNTPCLQKWRMFLDGSGVAGSVLYPTIGLATRNTKSCRSKRRCFRRNQAITSRIIRFSFPASSKRKSCPTCSASAWKKRSCIHRTIRTSGRH